MIRVAFEIWIFFAVWGWVIGWPWLWIVGAIAGGSVWIPTWGNEWIKVWKWFIHAIGRLNQWVLLTLIWVLVIVPIGMIKRIFRNDTMQYRKSTKSTFVS